MEIQVSFGVLVACAVLLIGVGFGAEKESKDPLVKAFDELKPEEKLNFLAYFLAVGLKDWADEQIISPIFNPIKGNIIKDLKIPDKEKDKFEKMDIPKESRLKLLNWAKSEFNLTIQNVLEMLKSKKHLLCCDIGSLCCPW